MTARLRLALVAAVAVVVVGGWVFVGCGTPEARTLPPPSSTSSTASTSTTSSIDFSRIPIEPVPGETTTTLRQFGGTILAGVVAGPQGAVPNAVVRIERLVGDSSQSFEVRTGEDGSWELAGAPGGRFRIRAFLPPTLAMDRPEIIFLADGEIREFTLRVDEYLGRRVTSGVTPRAPILGDAVAIAVRVTQPVVDDAGVVRQQPLPNTPVRVRTTGLTELQPDAVGLTDGSGTITFEYVCDRVGPVSATAVVGEEQEQVVLAVPDCAPVPTTTTTTTVPDDTGAGDGPGDDGPGDGDDPDDDDPPGSTSSTTTTTEG